MKKLTVAFWVLTYWFSSVAVASPINVRSGDHDGFTRLVMQVPPSVRWEMSSVPGRQYITFLGHEDGFDISRVFDIIPRNQLTNIVQYPSRLELVLSCACDTKVFVESGNFLVVDVIDGPPLPEENRVSDPSFVSLEPSSEFDFGELLWSGTESPYPSNLERDVLQEDTTDLDSAQNELISDLEAAVVAETRDRLLQGVAAAASRGLVEPSIVQLNLPVTEEEETPEAEIFDSSRQTLPDAQNELGNLRITNSRDIPIERDSLDLMSSGGVCPDSTAVQVTNWGDDRPFHEQVSSVRESLFSEVGRLNEIKALELARLYVFFGFGAEAKQVLRLSETLTKSNPELMDLASIVDFGFAKNPRSVHRYADCDSELSLWAIMAARTVSRDQVVNEDAALRTLIKLPLHLRDQIAPALSKRFTELGKTEAASIALRRVNLSKSEGANDANLARAKIEQRKGNIDAADKLLSDITQSNSKESPEALVAFVENRVNDLSPVPADISLLIESYAFEFEDSPIGTQLTRAHVLAAALSGQFAKAIKSLQNSVLYQDATISAELQSYIFSALAKDANDEDFLEVFFSHYPISDSDLTEQSVLSVAKRLNEMGFSSLAQKTLSVLPSDLRSKEHDILVAEISLDLEKPRDALQVLEDETGKAVDELRARSFLDLGQNGRAVELFQSSGAPETASRAAWLSDDWVDLTSQNSPVFGDIRSLAEEPVEDISTENGMIAATSSALEESAAAREIVAQLLEKVTVSQ
ncbi:hypothetical protein [Roseobacter sp.]|uniref:hypothetical protein n=1 Tax=Roseobacter sp. TaxID=1907202 RepID=UPI0038595B28